MKDSCLVLLVVVLLCWVGGGTALGQRGFSQDRVTGDKSGAVKSSSSGSDDFLVQRHLSTKTPYWVLSSPDSYEYDEELVEASIQASEDSTSDPTCELVHFNLVARHGARQPVLSAIQKLELIPQSLLSFKEMIVPEYQWIVNWTVPYPTTTAGNLILQGQYEHYNISQRYKQRFPEFFNKTYLPSTYPIRSTSVSRVGISASSFAFGLFQGQGELSSDNFQPVFITTPDIEEDNLLRFFDTCQKYQSLIDSNVINKSEQTKFNQLTFPNVSLQIATKLGLQDVWEPTMNVVDNIFSACAYEISIFGTYDRWCSLLSEENIKTWEYSQDLSNYWMKSYGNPYNYKIASILLQNIMNTLNGFVNNDYSGSLSSGSGSGGGSSSGSETPPHTDLKFGHAETIIPLITLLGLYNDSTPLLANATQEEIDNRLFRTSVISPYASNVAFFLYDCGSDGFKVKVEHNELPVLIPGCDQVYCKYTQFQEIFREVSLFNWNSYCDINSNSESPKPPSASSSVGGERDKENAWTSSKAEEEKVYLSFTAIGSFVFGVLASIGGMYIINLKKRPTQIQYSKLNSM